MLFFSLFNTTWKKKECNINWHQGINSSAVEMRRKNQNIPGKSIHLGER